MGTFLTLYNTTRNLFLVAMTTVMEQCCVPWNEVVNLMVHLHLFLVIGIAFTAILPQHLNLNMSTVKIVCLNLVEDIYQMLACFLF